MSTEPAGPPTAPSIETRPTALRPEVAPSHAAPADPTTSARTRRRRPRSTQPAAAPRSPVGDGPDSAGAASAAERADRVTHRRPDRAPVFSGAPPMRADAEPGRPPDAGADTGPGTQPDPIRPTNPGTHAGAGAQLDHHTETQADVDGAEPAVAPPRLITTPTHPVLGPVTTADELAEAVRRLRAGHGPIAVDAERASGYRYSQRAYLIQLARNGSGNILIDPVPFNPDTSGAGVGDLSELQDAIGGAEWVLHAASQDLPGLRELGLEPASVFDTETAGRLLGLERVSLASMLERFLDVTLEKGHSAADWSQRPLPADWLLYAALDVDLLVDLRDAVEAELIRAGKMSWAEQEWAATCAAPAAGPRQDPWRRTSGIHVLRSRRQLAAVQSLWETRDEIARARDIAPGRVLPDSAIVAAVRADPDSVEALTQLAVFRGPRQRQHAGRWYTALVDSRAVPDSELPPSAVGSRDGMPAPTRWRERDPDAAVRLAAVRAAVNTIAEQHHVQAQNLLAADVIRRVCWTPPAPIDVATVSAALTRLGARPWQVELCADGVAAALADPSADPSAEPAADPSEETSVDASDDASDDASAEPPIDPSTGDAAPIDEPPAGSATAT